MIYKPGSVGLQNAIWKIPWTHQVNPKIQAKTTNNFKDHKLYSKYQLFYNVQIMVRNKSKIISNMEHQETFLTRVLFCVDKNTHIYTHNV